MSKGIINVFYCVLFQSIYTRTLCCFAGYIYANGVPEYLVAIAMGLGGLTGIIGTVCYTKVRKRIGLERTGLFAFGAEILCLSFCVASIFAPGTKFQPVTFWDSDLSMCEAPATSTSSPAAVLGNLSSLVVKRDLSVRLRRHDAVDDYEASRYTTIVGLPAAQHGDLLSLFHSPGAAAAAAARPGGVPALRMSYSGLQAHVIHRRQTNGSADAPSYDVTPEHTNDSASIAVTTRRDWDECVDRGRDYVQYTSILLFLVGIISSRIGLSSHCPCA